MNPGEVNVGQEIKLIRTQLTTIIKEMTNYRQEMVTFRQEVVKLNSSVTDFNNRLNKLDEKFSHINGRLSEAESKINAVAGVDFNSKIEILLNDRYQDTFLTDIEITGVAEQYNENPVHLTTLVAQKVGVPIDERDIVSAERKGIRRGTASGVDSNSTPRPRVIVVRLARRALRDQLISAARSRRGVDTSGIVTTVPPHRVYINERLTWLNRRLFHKSREEGRSKGWKYVWTRDGRIYARRDTDSTALRIRSESDIERVFRNK